MINVVRRDLKVMKSIDLEGTKNSNHLHQRQLSHCMDYDDEESDDIGLEETVDGAQMTSIISPSYHDWM